MGVPLFLKNEKQIFKGNNVLFACIISHINGIQRIEGDLKTPSIFFAFYVCAGIQVYLSL